MPLIRNTMKPRPTEEPRSLLECLIDCTVLFHEVPLPDFPIWIEPDVNHDIPEVSVQPSHVRFQLEGEFLEVLLLEVLLPVERPGRVEGDWAARCEGHCAGGLG